MNDTIIAASWILALSLLILTWKSDRISLTTMLILTLSIFLRYGARDDVLESTPSANAGRFSYNDQGLVIPYLTRYWDSIVQDQADAGANFYSPINFILSTTQNWLTGMTFGDLMQDMTVSGIDDLKKNIEDQWEEEHLWISNIYFGKQASINLATAIEQNTHWTKIQFDFCFFKKTKNFDSSGGEENRNKIEEGLPTLVNALKSSLNINTIELENVRMEDEETTEMFAQVLRNNPTLKMLFWEKGELTSRSAIIIADAFAGNTALTHLSFTDNLLGNDGTLVLMNALMSEKSSIQLEYLGLETNEIGNSGGRSILKALEAGLEIEEISLYGNYIDSDIVSSITKKCGRKASTSHNS